MVSGATSAFVRPNVAAAAASPVYAPPTSRRVPQWTFLDRVIPDVVLGDPAAPALAGGGARVAGLRRALLGTGIAAALVVSFGVLRSWIGNRDLVQRTTVASAAVAALPVVSTPSGTIAFPSPDALRTLDGLRATLDTLRRYQANVPMRLQWGLWRGDALLADGRRVWLDGYRRQLHDVAWGALVDTLRALPDAPRPTDDYGRDYAALKAYLVTTAEPARSTPEFLAPVLLRAWQRGQPTDADVTALARRQFEFYASELPRANPWPRDADASVVGHARDFLGRFAGAERIYQFMLAEADKAAKPARLADLAPQMGGVVAISGDVPGSFTSDGWRFMQEAFRNSDRYFQGERWVVGDAGAAQAQDRDRVLATLRDRYRTDYVQRWRAYVAGLTVVRPSATRDAAQKLGVLGSPQSPLLAAFSLVARNTAVDSGVAAAFQPVHVVTAPTVLDKYVAEGNQPYVNALLGLQGAVEQVANTPSAVDTASAQQLAMAGQQALGQATQAKVAARQLAGKFNVDTAAAQIGPAVATLLEAPIVGAEGVLRGVASTRPPAARRVATGGGGAGAGAGGGGGGAAGGGGAPVGGGAANNAALVRILNERGAAVCAAMTPMLGKFPFNPDATAEATVGEVAGALAPGAGALWAFQQERLNGIIEKQGDQWVMKADSPVALSSQFLDFFNRAARVSAALFGGSPEPRVVFHARGVPTDKAPQIVLSQGTQVARFSKNTPPNQFVWPSTTGRDVVLSAEGSGRLLRGAKNRTIDRATGDWAIFRLVARAAKAEGGGSNLRAEWNNKDFGAIPVEFTFANGSPVLQRGWLGGMACAAQVTR
jgi:type VI secretion system protein ImpL